MHPVLFHVPGLGFPLRTFGALVAGGILLAIWLWGKMLARYGDDPARDPERGSQVALWVVVGVLVGARLFYVGVEVTRYATTSVTDPMRSYLAADDRGAEALRLGLEDREALENARRVAVGYDFVHDPLKVLLIWQGGLVMYGGLFGGILFGLWSTRKHGLRFWNALDTGLVCGFLGLMVGRWGCLMVGDDYGRVVPEAWRDAWRPIQLSNGGAIGPLTIQVPGAEWLARNPESLFDHELAGQVLWAAQPWMSVGALLISLWGWFWLRRRTRTGVPAALMLLLYSITRFTIEAFRGDEVRGLWFGGRISTSQLVSIGLFVFGLFLLVRRSTAGEAPPPVAGAPAR